jgi:alkaline phosphatase
MKRSLFFILVLISCVVHAQKVYTTSNAHSHNDYQQKNPFWHAWQQQFGSMEADIFLENGQLLVAHDKQQLQRRWTLDSLYLEPLQQCIAKNKGHVFPDSNRHLQLMIDIKSEAIAALTKLVEQLRKYPSLINCSTLHIAISGGRPPASGFDQWPSWILFDGELQKEYTSAQLQKIPMLSDNFSRYSSWDGKGEIPEKDKQALKGMIDKAHLLGKKIRFWNAPDTINAWKIFVSLGVDYINTDEIDGLSSFLQ